MLYFGHTGFERATTSHVADCQKRGPCFWETQGVDASVLRSGPLGLLGADRPAATDLGEAPLLFLIYLVPRMGQTLP